MQVRVPSGDLQNYSSIKWNEQLIQLVPQKMRGKSGVSVYHRLACDVSDHTRAQDLKNVCRLILGHGGARLPCFINIWGKARQILTMTDRTSVGLPQGPSSGPLTEAQWKVLMTIMDTFIAPCPEDTISSTQKSGLLSHCDISTLGAFLAETPSSLPLFQKILKRLLANLPPDKLSGIGTICSLLG